MRRQQATVYKDVSLLSAEATKEEDRTAAATRVRRCPDCITSQSLAHEATCTTVLDDAPLWGRQSH
jgi:hypothetical protein